VLTFSKQFNTIQRIVPVESPIKLNLSSQPPTSRLFRSSLLVSLLRKKASSMQRSKHLTHTNRRTPSYRSSPCWENFRPNHS
jgi:hypothetical protein